MTEREKCLAGELYSPADPELRKLHLQARKLFGKYNKIDPSNDKKLNKLIKKILGNAGNNVHVQPPFYCDYGVNISVGENFFANFDCVFLDAAPIEIGDNCMIGPKTCIYAVTHPLDFNERLKGINIPKKVSIGNNVWIGGGVTILPGVSLGNNVVVGAGSVVTKSFPDNVIIAGNPATIIKKL